MLNYFVSVRQKILGSWHAMRRPYNCKIWGSHSRVVWDSGFFGMWCCVMPVTPDHGAFNFMGQAVQEK